MEEPEYPVDNEVEWGIKACQLEAHTGVEWALGNQ